MENTVQFGHFQLIRTLGKGASAKVKLAVNTDSGEEVALKIFGRTLGDRFEAEVSALEQVSGLPNVLRVLSHEGKAIYCPRHKPPREVAFIELEYCAHGELINFIFSRGAFPEAITKRCAYELLHGLSGIHRSSLAHRDLKPENILVTQEFEIKIADFGFAKEVGVSGTSPCRTYRGTKGYFAPEVLNREIYNGQKVDVFALGVILFTLFTARPPFTQAHMNDRYYTFIESGKWTEFWARNQRVTGTPIFPPEFKGMLERMLCRNPANRLSCDELLEHEWLRSGMCDREALVTWLSNSQPVTVEGDHSGDGGDPHYRELQLSYNNSLESDMESVGFFRCTSRSALPRTNTQLGVYANLHPDRLYEAISTFLIQKNATIIRDMYVFKLKARVPSEDDPLEFLCCLCEADCASVRIEFTRISGEHTAFFRLLQDVIQVIQCD